MKNETTQTLAAIVDRLGALKAAAADLASESEILKGELILAGVATIDGGLFRATVSHCPGRESVDWKALALALGATDREIAAHTTAGVPYSVVRLAARKGA
jgi:hypothetical protein